MLDTDADQRIQRVADIGRWPGDDAAPGPLIDDVYHSVIHDYLATLRLRDLDVSVVHGGHFPSFGKVRYRQLVDEYLAQKRQAGCHLPQAR